MSKPRNFLVTGGAGFIGSAVCRRLIRSGHRVVNVDKLTYAGTLTSVREIEQHPNYHFIQADICDEGAILRALAVHDVEIVMHLAAESHVDRSIDGPSAFVETNVVGTYRMLSASLGYWRSLPEDKRSAFRFHHVSTDEVYGDLPFDSGCFTEDTPYAPSSPYSASKAASDHFASAWRETYGLPVIITNCSNNYGPYHFPEKLIPLVILNAMEGKAIPVYGKGANVRDWLYVEDHARALESAALIGVVGESYNIGGRAERTNLEVVEAICGLLDRLRPREDSAFHRDLIAFVADRPGHDRRYAIDPSKAERELDWRAEESFESGLEKTVLWYLANEWWWGPLRQQRYSGQRLGVSESK